MVRKAWPTTKLQHVCESVRVDGMIVSGMAGRQAPPVAQHTQAGARSASGASGVTSNQAASVPPRQSRASTELTGVCCHLTPELEVDGDCGRHASSTCLQRLDLRGHLAE
jgi:hypothetical protein